jgi:hypothetical protein
MENVRIISVIPGLTQWSVREQDIENPIAYFTTCNEAVKYAKAIAESKPSAILKIMDKNGKATSEQYFRSKTH